MPRFQHIVVGIDEGDFADQAVVTAVHLSRLVDAPLEIVHAVRTNAERPWLVSESLIDHLEHSAEVDARRDRTHHLRRLLHDHATTHPEIEEMLHVVSGRPSTVLGQHLAEREGAMLVLGGHRHRGLFDAGTTREVLAHLLAPLWVQGKDSWKTPERVLVLLDLSPGSTPILSLGRDLAEAAGGELTVMHCCEPPLPLPGDANSQALVQQLEDAARDRFEQFLEKPEFKDRPMLRRFEMGNLAEVVFAAQEDYDVLVMGTHGYSGVSRVLFGNHAYRILNEVEKPVVVVPQPTVV